MTKMVNNSDVEDVLFSIRRLVSDAPEVRPAPVVAGDDDAKSDALFLTSSLRVSDPATEPEQVDLEDMNSDMSHFREAIGREEMDVEQLPSLDEVFADKISDDAPRRLHLSEVVTDATPTAQNVYFEDEDIGDLDARKWTADPDTETLSDFATPEDTFGTPSDDVNQTENVDDASVNEAAPAQDVVDEIASEWEEDAASDQADGDEVDSQKTIEDAIAEANAPIEDEVTETDGLEELAETGEAEVAEEDNTEDQLAATEMLAEAEDLVDEPSETDEAIEDDEEDVSAAAVGLADFDEDVLDEDALRDMVTEIVREELSGELGERITRNVRKLVRREIHRALMTREFD